MSDPLFDSNYVVNLTEIAIDQTQAAVAALVVSCIAAHIFARVLVNDVRARQKRAREVRKIRRARRSMSDA